MFGSQIGIHENNLDNTSNLSEKKILIIIWIFYSLIRITLMLLNSSIIKDEWYDYDLYFTKNAKLKNILNALFPIINVFFTEFTLIYFIIAWFIHQIMNIIKEIKDAFKY